MAFQYLQNTHTVTAYHKSVLNDVWTLYTKPNAFQRRLAEQSLPGQLSRLTLMAIHLLPYVLFSTYIARYLLMLIGTPNSPKDWADMSSSIFTGVAGGAAGGVVVGIAICASGAVSGRISDVLSEAISIGLVFGLTVALSFGGAFKLGYGLIGTALEGLTFGVAIGIAISTSIGITNGRTIVARFALSAAALTGLAIGLYLAAFDSIDTGIVLGTTSAIGIATAATRVYYLPLHVMFLWPVIRGHLYTLHPVAWDPLCATSFPGLDLLLADYVSHDSFRGDKEINRLASEYTSQHHLAIKAQARVIARKAATAKDLSETLRMVQSIPQGSRGWLSQTSQILTDVAAIAEQQEGIERVRNLPVFFRKQSEILRDFIQNFSIRVSGLDEPLASEFRHAATEWLVLAEKQVQDAAATIVRERVPQVFRAGDPVNIELEAFVPRRSVIDELAAHVVASTGCPGLLLYARRRMGKSSCLRNLTEFLPSQIEVVHLNLQDPGISGSEELFCSKLATAIDADQASRDSTRPTTLVELGTVLNTLNERLRGEGRRLLIGLDEYEYLDAMLGQQALPRGLPALFRTSIQEHRNLIWVFAGSHQIRELKNAQWPSALISVRTIEIDRFTPQETDTLLTHPLEHSRLWPPGSPDRPTFQSEFWGPGGIQRLRDIADGWPHLVILLAEICVNLVNQRNAEYVTEELFEEAVQKTVIQGDNVMIQLLQNESELPGEWEYLFGFKIQKMLPVPEDAAVFSSLQRRSLIRIEDGQVRLRVPLMQLWMEKRA